MQNIIGYHSYFLYQPEPLHPLLALGQLLSVKLWKQHFGDMHLLCNQAHVDQLREYGIEKEYTTLIPHLDWWMPSGDKRWWSLAKLSAVERASERHKQFAVIDTDLWLLGVPSTFSATAPLQMLHWEGFDEALPDSPYCTPAQMGRKGKMPTAANAAFLYFSDNELARAWIKSSHDIVYSTTSPTLPNNQETIFLEQRLLPALAKNRLSVLLGTTFQTHLCGTAETAWTPEPSTLPDTQLIRHIWGQKKYLSNPAAASKLAKVLLKDAQAVDLSGYSHLLSTVETYL